MAVLRALIEKCAQCVVVERYGRAVEVADEAAALAFELVRCRRLPAGPGRRSRARGPQFGDDSVVGADLLVAQASHCNNQALMGAPSDQLPLFLEAWDCLQRALAVLVRRLASRTLLPGCCREEEETLFMHLQWAIWRAEGHSEPLPGSAAVQAASATTVGYSAALGAVWVSLCLMRRCSGWPEPQLALAQVFVRSVLDAVPQTAGLPAGFAPGAELKLVAYFDRETGSPGGMDPAFFAAVWRAWRGEGVARVLRGRGSLLVGPPVIDAYDAAAAARRAADVAKRGLRRCGLPACGRQELTVRHFQLCGGCSAVAYCSDAHHAAHWKEGHRRECGALKAAGAKPPSTADVNEPD